MGIVEILAALGSIAGLGLFGWKQMKSTPDQKRRKSLVKLDDAFKKAKKHNSVEDIAKWFGERL